MNKLLIILSLCFVFATELEIDGDLKVTGNIEAGTIDSLQQVIAGLQAQIVLIQSQLSSLQQSANSSLKLIHVENDASGYIYSFNVAPNSINDILLFNLETKRDGYLQTNLILYVDDVETQFFGGSNYEYYNDGKDFTTDIFYFYPTEDQINNGFSITLDGSQIISNGTLSYTTLFVYGK